MKDNSHAVTAQPPLIAPQLAEFVTNLELEAVPAHVQERARYLILDAIGIAYASTQFDFAHRTLSALTELGEGTEPVIGLSARLSLRDSVTLNGLLIHGLDFDDTHVPGVIHATASCLPAALGVAAHQGRHGRDLLLAYIAGMEATTRLGTVAKGGFHQVGFHPTGLVGAFGCALIAGRLQNATAHHLAMAQGIALSLASGSLEFLQDGAWTKRFHPGWAAAAGITAATLARHGFKGPNAAYEGRFGLYASHLGEKLLAAADLSAATQGLGQAWEIMNVAVKPLPACHFTHACADAAMALRREHNIGPDDIEHVRALVPQEVIKTVCEPVQHKKVPQNGYDAQFSIPYAVASGLVRGHFGLADLEESALRDPVALSVAAKVDYEIDPNSRFPKYYSGEIIVKLKDGRTVTWREDINRGASDRPLSNAEIEAKFLENASLAVSPARARALRDAVLTLDQTDARSLADALAA